MSESLSGAVFVSHFTEKLFSFKFRHFATTFRASSIINPTKKETHREGGGLLELDQIFQVFHI